MMRLADIGISDRATFNKPRRRGDFDICINKDCNVTQIPANLYNFIVTECNARNAETVMEYLRDHPRTIATILRWTEEEAMMAFRKLAAYVNGVLAMPQPSSMPRKRTRK